MPLVYSRHGTLTASAVSTVTMSANVQTIIVKIHGSGYANVTFDGSTPTVDGDNTARVDAGGVLHYSSTSSNATESVKMISAGTPGYSVEAYD